MEILDLTLLGALRLMRRIANKYKMDKKKDNKVMSVERLTEIMRGQ